MKEENMTGGSAECRTDVVPIEMETLYEYGRDKEDDGVRILQRRLAKPPLSRNDSLFHQASEIEILLVEDADKHQNRHESSMQIHQKRQNRHGRQRRRRILVRGGNKTLHVSFELPLGEDVARLHHERDPLLCISRFLRDDDDSLVGSARSVGTAGSAEGDDEVKDDEPNEEEEAKNVAEDSFVEVLCVLSSPTTIVLLDIYGNDFLAGGEGHEIHLPFEARAIFAIPTTAGGGGAGAGRGGILVQRRATPEDALTNQFLSTARRPKTKTTETTPGSTDRIRATHANAATSETSETAPNAPAPNAPEQNAPAEKKEAEKEATTKTKRTNTTSSDPMVDMDDNGDDFMMLQDPPLPVRLMEPSTPQTPTTPTTPTTPNQKNENSTARSDHERDQQHDNDHHPMIPSLFSIQHPMEQALPVAYVPVQSNNRALGLSNHFTDVFETVLFAGEATWMSSQNNTVRHTRLCVTFHQKRKRHAVWRILPAPPPPPTPFLWQLSSSSPSHNPQHTQHMQHMQHTQHTHHMAGVVAPDADFLITTQTKPLGSAGDLPLSAPPIDNIDNNTTFMSSSPQTSYADPLAAASSRNEALAEAMGVARPRASTSRPILPPAPPLVAVAVTQNSKPPSQHAPPPPAPTVAPPPISLRNKANANANPNGVPRTIDRITAMVTPLLHPSMAMELLHEEEEEDNTMYSPSSSPSSFSSSPQKKNPSATITTTASAASHVFLASNFQATGTLVLCLVIGGEEIRFIHMEEEEIENEDENETKNENDMEEEQFPTTPGEGSTSTTSHRHDLASTPAPKRQRQQLTQPPLLVVKKVSKLGSCLGASPIQCIPLPPSLAAQLSSSSSSSSSCSSSSCRRMKTATDILVVNHQNELLLYRSDHFLAPCSLTLNPRTTDKGLRTTNNLMTASNSRRGRPRRPPPSSRAAGQRNTRRNIVTSVHDALEHCVDVKILIPSGSGNHRTTTTTVRASLHLVSPDRGRTVSCTSPTKTSEMCLAVLEDVLFYRDDFHQRHLAELALWIRIDSVCLGQQLVHYRHESTNEHHDRVGNNDTLVPPSSSLDEDPMWTAVSTLLLHIIEQLAYGSAATPLVPPTPTSQRDFGLSSHSHSSGGTTTTRKNGGARAWDQLLQSDFHSLYYHPENKGIRLFPHHRHEHFHSSKNNSHTTTTACRQVSSSSLSSSSPSSSSQLAKILLASMVSRSQQFLSSLTTTAAKTEAPTFSAHHGHDCPIVYRLFDALHLLYEDMKLSKSCSETQRRQLAFLLVQCCLLVTMGDDDNDDDKHMMEDFLDHYERDCGDSMIGQAKRFLRFRGAGQNMHATASHLLRRPRQRLSSFPSVPCFYSFVDKLMKGHDVVSSVDATVFGGGANNQGGMTMTTTSSTRGGACHRTRTLFKALMCLFANQESTSDPRQRDADVIRTLIQEGYTKLTSLLDIPVGVSLPLLQVLLRCGRDPGILLSSPASSDPHVWKLIGREDIGRQMTISRYSSDYQCHFAKPSPIPNSNDQGGFVTNTRDVVSDVDEDGLVPLEHSSAILFPEDNRLREVGRLLRSSRPNFFKVPRAVEVSDHDYERLKQENLVILCQRVQALPLGRGMFTFGTLPAIPAEPLPVPQLCLAGRIPPTNTKLILDRTNLPAHMTTWPLFHNGCSAGLRLPLAASSSNNVIHEEASRGGSSRGRGTRISRAWIISNRSMGREQQQQPQQQNQNSNSSNNNHAGNNNDSENGGRQPSHAHGGLLLALGLRNHLEALSMTDLYEYLTQGTVTTSVGVLLGMAANKRGSCDPSVSKILCLHIPSLLPPSFSSIEISGPAHASAITGIGLLYQGSSHRLMTEFLLNELGRRPSHDSNGNGNSNTTGSGGGGREAYSLSCGLALGMVNLARGDSVGNVGGGNAGLSDLDIELRLNRYILGGPDHLEQTRRTQIDLMANGGVSSSHDAERSSRISEGENINNDVTAPGATLALALMYLKTGNKTIASSLALPNTHFLLEYIRPDFCCLRIIARCMILWDEVKPSSSWIDEQIPSVVRASYRNMKLAVLRSVGGVVDNLGDTVLAHDILDTDHLENNINSTRPPFVVTEHDSDRHAVRQIHVFATAGACFGIGLRFAGTGNQDARDAISRCITAMNELREGNGPLSTALRPAERPILELCLGLCAISLGVVMAGTGDLVSLRILKVIRWRCDDTVKYGNHMASAAAVGLLFLGGGRCTLGRSNQDIAALVMAFFPRFPMSTTDNQYHLQALRHFYALAAKERDIRVVEIDSLTSISVPIEVEYSNPHVNPIRKLTAPCLLLNTESRPVRIRVVSAKVFPTSVDISSTVNGNRSGIVVYVKAKTKEHLEQFHQSLHLALPTTSSAVERKNNPIMSPSTKQEQPMATTIPLDDDNDLVMLLREEESEHERPFSPSRSVTLELLRNVESYESTASAWNLRLVRTYYDHLVRSLQHRHAGAADVDPSWMAYLAQIVETVDNKMAVRVDRAVGEDDDVVSNQDPDGAVKRVIAEQCLGSVLTWYNVCLEKTHFLES